MSSSYTLNGKKVDVKKPFDAIMAGVAPFVLEDLAKIAFAAFLGTALRDRLIRAGLFPGKKHYPLTINQNL